MSSDADYQSFLDKANQDVSGSGKAKTSQTASTQAVNTEVPKALEQVEEYYVSDADEPFEPVSLKYSGSGVPSEGRRHEGAHLNVSSTLTGLLQMSSQSCCRRSTMLRG